MKISFLKSNWQFKRYVSKFLLDVLYPKQGQYAWEMKVSQISQMTDPNWLHNEWIPFTVGSTICKNFEPQLFHAVTNFKTHISNTTSFSPQNHEHINFETPFRIKSIFSTIDDDVLCKFYEDYK